MTTTTKTQLRGHCPDCGRLHAAEGGLAKHGYRVPKNWGVFVGTCPGAGYPAIELDRARVDANVATHRATAAEARTRADDLEAGRVDPQNATVGRMIDGRHERVTIAYADLYAHEQRDTRRALVWNLRSRAAGLEDFAVFLSELANRRHGLPLVAVQRPDAPAPILAGERRTLGGGSVATAGEVIGARVYWTITRDNGRKMTGWTGTQAWRRLPIAE